MPELWVQGKFLGSFGRAHSTLLSPGSPILYPLAQAIGLLGPVLHHLGHCHSLGDTRAFYTSDDMCTCCHGVANVLNARMSVGSDVGAQLDQQEGQAGGQLACGFKS